MTGITADGGVGPVNRLAHSQVVAGDVGAGTCRRVPHVVRKSGFRGVEGVNAVLVVAAVTYPETGVVGEAGLSELCLRDDLERRQEGDFFLAVDVEGEVGNFGITLNQCAIDTLGVAGVTEGVLVICRGSHSFVVTNVTGDGG